MKKDKLNQLLREYVKNNLSPKVSEQNLVASVYDAIKNALGSGCLLVGSYARFTAITPMHDIDIIFIDGSFAPRNINPKAVLDKLEARLRSNFKNPTKYTIKISQQTHSIGVVFFENNREMFAVDIVPAYISGSKNEFGDDIYFVPQILNTNRRYRLQRYIELNKSILNEVDWWLKSDPHGYIKAAAILNSKNNDFRRATKFIKRWKHSCKENNPDFKLKSFHLEQVLFGFFKQNMNLEIMDAVFSFFCSIPDIIQKAQIKDRADDRKHIDDYINNLTDIEKQKIIEARDRILIDLENITSAKPISTLLSGDSHKRACNQEEYLFDHSIPVYLEDGLTFKIDGKVLPKDGFRDNWWLGSRAGRIEKHRKIEFQIIENSTNAYMYKWKVKNDNSCLQPRGEITDYSTHIKPESTKFSGNHYVECYAIANNVCIAKSRSNVVIA